MEEKTTSNIRPESDSTITTPHSVGQVRKARLLAGALILIIVLGTGFLGGWLGARNEKQVTTSTTQQVVLKSQGELISQIAKNVGSSVVSINTTQTASQDGFFASAQGRAAGTGIILNNDGLIITNRHVVPAGTTNVSVTLSDGTKFDDVTIVGRTNTNDSLDIAFLKIKDLGGKKLAPIKIGDSSKAQIGDPVVAIGNALGQFDNTVTSGIISGHGRRLQASSGDGSGSENLEDMFQTDAAINEGNSGGPLVNLDGELIGINTAIAQEAQNIGFAIPINDVTGLIRSVISTGKLQRPYLGVVYMPITDDLAKQLNLKVNRGAYIAPPSLTQQQSPVIKDGPADKAGLQVGDIITKVNDTGIDENNSLTGLLGRYGVGDKVKLTVLRSDKTITLTATLAAAPTS